MNRHDSRIVEGEPPAKRGLVAALIGDDSGRNLVVKPSYRTTWTLPGGVVGEAESPRHACQRQIQDVLGIAIPIGRLLCVDWVAPRKDLSDGYAFIFDAGETRSANMTAVRLNPTEIEDMRFVDAGEFDALLAPAEARRTRGAITARAKGTASYLDNGEDPLNPMVVRPRSVS